MGKLNDDSTNHAEVSLIEKITCSGAAVCPSLLAITPGNLWSSLSGTASLVLGLFPHVNYTD